MKDIRNIDFHDSTLVKFDYIDGKIIMKMTGVFMDNSYKNVDVICYDVTSAKAENSKPIKMLFEDGGIILFEVVDNVIKMLIEWCDYKNPNMLTSFEVVSYEIVCKKIDVSIYE